MEVTREREAEAPISAALPPGALVIGAEGMFHHPPPADLLTPRIPTSLHGLGLLVRGLGHRPQVWVHRAALERLGLPGNPPSDDIARLPGILAARGALTTRRWPPRDWSCVHWYEPGGAGFDLHVPEWRKAPGSPFATCATAWELVQAVGAYLDATGGRPWVGSGAVTSDAWLRKGAKATTSPPPLAEGSVREVAPQWARAPLQSEARLRYLHSFDLNGAYLAAAGSLELPSGEPVHRDFPPFDKRVPGVWHVELPDWEDRGGGVWKPGWEAGRTAWVTTPTMELLHDAQVEPIEAWTWPDHARHLRRWQEALRDARARLLQRGTWDGPAGAAVKAVYQHGPGRLASRDRLADPPEQDPLYQPYWDLAVIAESRCRLWRKVEPFLPGVLAVDRDAIFVLSSRTPASLAAHLGLELDPGLGKWKHAGSAPAGDVCAALARAHTPAGAVKFLREAVKA